MLNITRVGDTEEEQETWQIWMYSAIIIVVIIVFIAVVMAVVVLVEIKTRKRAGMQRL